MIHLDLDDLLEAARAFLGHDPLVRDYGLLESALARPGATVCGIEAYPTIYHQAAALLDSLVNNHALVDGNKRLGLVGVELFLRYNGFRMIATDDEKFDLVMAVASGQLRDIDKIAEYLESMTVDYPTIY